MTRLQISASLMCADLLNLTHDLKVLEAAGTDYLHIDIMDGHFVPNITLGFDIANSIGRHCSLRRDFHLMVKDPYLALSRLHLQSDDVVTLHIEAVTDLASLSTLVKPRGARLGLAISPDTPIATLRPHLSLIDHILVMTVQPGFAGSRYVQNSPSRVAAVARLAAKVQNPITIGVDGAIGHQQIRELSQVGASYFVLGTSALFKQVGDLHHHAQTIKEFIYRLEGELDDLSCIRP